MTAERNQLADALRRYGGSPSDCDPDEGCSCRLAAVLHLAETTTDRPAPAD